MNVYCKQRNTYQENYKNFIKQKSVVFEPRPLPPFPPTPNPTHRSTPDCCSFSSPQRAFFLGGAVYQHFSSWPQLCVAEAESQASAVEKWQFSSSTQPPLTRLRLYIGCSVLRRLGSWSSCSLPGLWVGGSTSGWCPLPNVQLLEQECHSERSWPLSPIPVPEPWLRDFAQREEQTIKQLAPNVFPKELILFTREHGEAQT